ncbi:hypothetical protein [Nocardia farcinica]|uniref:hypothetical protein n=1 Tax=Nocardia farcinica TaxID=37329 RepID=UPI002458B5A6|nr:hypothetical protein [Nocardia farcinica]
MGTSSKPAAPYRSFILRPATVLLGGAVCAAVVGTGPALADPAPPPIQMPVIHAVGQVPGAPPGGLAELVDAALGLLAPPPLTPPAPLAPPPPGVPAPLAALPAPAAEPMPALPMPALGAGPVEAVAPPEVFGAATPAPAAAPVPADTDPGLVPVADSAAPQTDRVRIGRVELDRPGALPPEQAAQINAGAAGLEDGLSDVLDSTGFEPRRSDQIAAHVVGDAAIGAAIGGIAIAPVAAGVGALVGGGIGFLFGIPFLPTGLVVGPVVGATLVYSMITVPAIVTGAVIGAGVGAVEGANAPLPPEPPSS